MYHNIVESQLCNYNLACSPKPGVSHLPLNWNLLNWLKMAAVGCIFAVETEMQARLWLLMVHTSHNIPGNNCRNGSNQSTVEETHHIRDDGRYFVKLPPLGNSKQMTEKRFYHNEHSLRWKELLDSFINTINEYNERTLSVLQRERSTSLLAK